MAVQTIQYQNKAALNINPDIADINKVTDNDMNEIKSVVNNNAGETSNNTTDLTNLKTYSTSEVNTGKIWTDGKPIYRKVISIPSFSNTEITVSTGITNIEEIINFQGSYSRDGYTRRYSIDNIYIDEWYINLSDGKIVIKTNNQYVRYRGYITIEYTKTTD